MGWKIPTTTFPALKPWSLSWNCPELQLRRGLSLLYNLTDDAIASLYVTEMSVIYLY